MNKIEKFMVNKTNKDMSNFAKQVLELINEVKED